jgi:hypothetical protein
VFIEVSNSFHDDRTGFKGSHYVLPVIHIVGLQPRTSGFNRLRVIHVTYFALAFDHPSKAKLRWCFPGNCANRRDTMPQIIRGGSTGKGIKNARTQFS